MRATSKLWYVHLTANSSHGSRRSTDAVVQNIGADTRFGKTSPGDRTPAMLLTTTSHHQSHVQDCVSQSGLDKSTASRFEHNSFLEPFAKQKNRWHAVGSRRRRIPGTASRESTERTMCNTCNTRERGDSVGVRQGKRQSCRQFHCSYVSYIRDPRIPPNIPLRDKRRMLGSDNMLHNRSAVHYVCNVANTRLVHVRIRGSSRD